MFRDRNKLHVMYLCIERAQTTRTELKRRSFGTHAYPEGPGHRPGHPVLCRGWWYKTWNKGCVHEKATLAMLGY